MVNDFNEKHFSSLPSFSKSFFKAPSVDESFSMKITTSAAFDFTVAAKVFFLLFITILFPSVHDRFMIFYVTT
jgi:hypothetical protein